MRLAIKMRVNMRKWLTTMLLLAAAVPGAQAQDRPLLNWMVLDLPPGSKPINGELSDGINDQLLKMVFAEMPGFRHRIVVVNTTRAMSNLAEGVPACFGSAAYSPERERVAYFSLAFLIPPLHIVARADAVARLPKNERGEVLAGALFDLSDLRGLIVPQRAYSAALDEMLAHRAASSGVRTVLANDGGANILKMLKLSRGDYTIEYDFVVGYLSARSPELAQGPELRLLPVAGAEAFPVGIACPHTEWGRRVIEQVDAVLTRLAGQPAYRDTVRRWLTPDSARRYQKPLDDFIQQRANASPPGKYPPWPSVR